MAHTRSFLPLVRRTAMRLARRVPATITVADLVGYGWVGLMEAYQRSEPGMPDEEFEAYALYRVRGAMLDYLRSLDPTTRDLRRASRQVTRTIRDLTERARARPGGAEIATKLNLDIRAFRELLDKIAAGGMARLELLDLDDVDLASSEQTVDEEVDQAQARPTPSSERWTRCRRSSCRCSRSTTRKGAPSGRSAPFSGSPSRASRSSTPKPSTACARR